MVEQLGPFGDPSTDLLVQPDDPVPTDDPSTPFRSSGLDTEPIDLIPGGRAIDLYGSIDDSSPDLYGSGDPYRDPLDRAGPRIDEPEPDPHAEAVRMLWGLGGIATTTLVAGVVLFIDAASLGRVRSAHKRAT